MKYLALERLNPAQLIARNTYRRVNESVIDFFRDLGGVEALPESFDVCGEGWKQAEEEIDAMALAGEIEKTANMCAEYERRALAYFERWRKKLEKRNGNGNSGN